MKKQPNKKRGQRESTRNLYRDRNKNTFYIHWNSIKAYFK